MLRFGQAIKQGKFPKLLKGKSVRVIVTMGMPAFVYRWRFGSHVLKLVKQNILRFMGVQPVRWVVYGNFEGAGPPGSAPMAQAG